VLLPAVKAVDTVCFVCNIVVLTVAQACTVASAFCQCVVWCLGVTLQRRWMLNVPLKLGTHP
jgi:hypothetical protein